MRWLRLYLKSRRIPLALTLAAATIALVWALWLTFSDSPGINVRLISLTVMLAVAAFGATLGGSDEALDSTGSLNWPIRRAGHLLLTGGAILALLALTMVSEARFEPLAVVLRNTAGILGLTALGAALFGVARAWIAPLVWTLVAILPMMQPSTDLRMQVAGWLIQPGGTTAATVCAVVLAGGGLVAYTLMGCPRNSPSDQ